MSTTVADGIGHCLLRLDPHVGERVLDVATGTGWTARRLAARGAAVVGIDFGLDLIATAHGLCETADWRGDDQASAPAMTPVRQTQTQTRGRRPMASDDEIDDLLTKGYKRREAEAMLRQQGKGLDHNRWAARNAARQQGSSALGVSAADGDGQ